MLLYLFSYDEISISYVASLFLKPLGKILRQSLIETDALADTQQMG